MGRSFQRSRTPRSLNDDDNIDAYVQRFGWKEFGTNTSVAMAMKKLHQKLTKFQINELQQSVLSRPLRDVIHKTGST